MPVRTVIPNVQKKNRRLAKEKRTSGFWGKESSIAVYPEKKPIQTAASQWGGGWKGNQKGTISRREKKKRKRVSPQKWGEKGRKETPGMFGRGKKCRGSRERRKGEKKNNGGDEFLWGKKKNKK